MGTKLPGKVGLLARVLVETMALTNKRKLCLLLHHQLTPEVRRHILHRDFSLSSIRRTLVGDHPSRSSWHMYWTFLRVSLSMEGISPNQYPLQRKQSLPRIPNTLCGLYSFHRSLWKNGALHGVLLTKVGVSPSQESGRRKIFISKRTQQRDCHRTH